MHEPDFSQGAAFVRGAFVPIGEACVPITDWGFLRSDAAYDVVTVWDGAFFRLDDHVQRFQDSCARFRLDAGLPPERIRAVLAHCVRLAGLQRAYVEMVVTRGQPPWGSRDPRQAVNQFYAFAVPYVWIADEQQRAQGLHLSVSAIQRIPATSVDPRAKNYHWNDLTMGLLGALDAGADSVVLGDGAGNVVEGPGFNVFAVLADGSVATPAQGMLEGITRRSVIEICQSLGVALHQRALAAAELRGAREVFVSTSAGGVLPVTRIDGQPVGDGQVGALTRRIVDTYWDWHRRDALRTPVDYGASAPITAKA
ncbi:D-amino acid aminotransferase [Comamonas faecalis]|uniref:branched-chain-amino-acid transaminase n=1 Tax=Comamonas faecalis TaxID=1387849 RepID=A0ABP7R2V9_9BURK